MRRNYLILAVFAVSCFMLLQVSCPASLLSQESREGMVPEPKAAPATLKPASSPTKAKTAAEAKGLVPKIRVENAIHDFGEVGPGTKNICEFNFTNIGDGLLKISKIQTICGCTVAKLSKRKYMPGESGTVEVNYKASLRPASITKNLYILSNDKKNSKAKLTIKARIAPKVTYEPKKLNLLLKKENAGYPEIRLTSLDNRPFAIKQFKSTANCITADYDPSEKKTEFVLEPKVDIKKLQRVLNGRISISLTHPECGTVTIPFKVLPRFKITPASLVVFKAEPQKPIIRDDVWVLNNYDEDFEIESTSSQKGIIKVLCQKKVGKRYNLKLEITPPGAEHKKRVFTDVFYVNIKRGEKLRINCRGFYAKNKKNR